LLREEFGLLKLILHSKLRRRAASRRALPCPSSIVTLYFIILRFAIFAHVANKNVIIYALKQTGGKH